MERQLEGEEERWERERKLEERRNRRTNWTCLDKWLINQDHHSIIHHHLTLTHSTTTNLNHQTLIIIIQSNNNNIITSHNYHVLKYLNILLMYSFPLISTELDAGCLIVLNDESLSIHSSSNDSPRTSQMLCKTQQAETRLGISQNNACVVALH